MYSISENAEFNEPSALWVRLNYAFQEVVEGLEGSWKLFFMLT